MPFGAGDVATRGSEARWLTSGVALREAGSAVATILFATDQSPLSALVTYPAPMSHVDWVKASPREAQVTRALASLADLPPVLELDRKLFTRRARRPVTLEGVGSLPAPPAEPWGGSGLFGWYEAGPREVLVLLRHARGWLVLEGERVEVSEVERLGSVAEAP